MKKPRIVFLASGRGSCFEAIVKAIHAEELQADAVGLISNKQDAPALDRARRYGVPCTVLEARSYRTPDWKWDRAAYDTALMSAVRKFNPDWVCLAGYMLLLAPGLVKKYEGKIINIHPSLLPAFPGLNAIGQAIKAGVRETGCTVHFVTEKLDAGPIILQTKMAIKAGDSAESVAERLLPLEHKTYVEAMRKVLQP